MTKLSPKRKLKRVLFNRRNGIAFGILLVCFLIYWWIQNPHLDWLTTAGFERGVKQLGAWAPFLYIILIALSVVISPIPGAALAVVAGAVWGAILAGIYSIIGGFIGSLIAYFLGYSLGRSTIKAITGKAIYFSQRRGEIYVGWIIFITRLLPVLSFDLISYGAGISGLSLPIYAIATLLGMIPSTLLLTYMGSAFTMSLPLAIAFTTIFLALLTVVPWGMQKHNWFGMRDVIRID